MATKYTARQKLALASELRSAKAAAARVKRNAKIMALHEKGMKQMQIAEKIGITYQRVGQIINESK